jgi:hypothetical protein
MAARTALLVVLAGLVAAPPATAQHERVFTVVGEPRASRGAAQDGILATDATFTGDLDAVAAAPDGSFVFVSDDIRVWRVDTAGRLRKLVGGGRGNDGDGGPSTEARIGSISDVAIGPDGSVFLADILNCNVRRIAPDGTISTVAGQRTRVQPGRCRDRGDDGPAEQAELCYPWYLAAAPGGALAIASECGRVRVIGADGVIRHVAGGSGPRPSDGGDAARARFDDPIEIAFGADGRLVLADPDEFALWAVTADGRLDRWEGLPPHYSPLRWLLLPDGGALFANQRRTPSMDRWWPDGRLTPLLSRRRMSSPYVHDHDGDGGELAVAPVEPLDMAVAADGGLLLVEDRRIRYVAPAHPGRPAIGITRETLAPGLPLRVTVQTTLAAHATFTVSSGAGVLGTTSAELPAGRSTVTVPGADARRLNVVRVDTGEASDRLGVLPGGRLPRSVAKASFLDEPSRCVRLSARRVDCGAGTRHRCLLAESFYLRPNGTFTYRFYRGGGDRPCRLRRHPRWDGPRRASPLPIG